MDKLNSVVQWVILIQFGRISIMNFVVAWTCSWKTVQVNEWHCSGVKKKKVKISINTNYSCLLISKSAWKIFVGLVFASFLAVMNALENVCSMDLVGLSDLIMFPNVRCMFLKFCVLKIILSWKCELLLACRYHYLVSRRRHWYLFHRRVASCRLVV